MKKKFKVTLVVFLVVVLGCFSQVFAATNQNNKADKISQVSKNARFLQSASTDDGVVGTSNLNGAADNSAKVGDQLTSPEIGWKRYDDTNSKIKYTKDWINHSCSGCYNNTETYSNTSGITKNISFSFYGTRFRIIGNKYPTYGSAISVIVDGTKVDTYNASSSLIRQVLLYNYDSNKPMASHSVVLQFDQSISDAEIDAIDIDSTGYLIDPSATLATGISLNKTSDVLTTGQTDTTLTATVTPDNTTNKTVTWKSSDKDIVQVDENTGVITSGSKAGTATITATTTDGTNLSASCTVTVTESTNPTNNSDKAVLNITMTNGEVKQYNVTMDTVNKFISWYRLRSAGSGDPFYEFDITQTSSPTIIKTDYVVFDKISSFEVDDYTK